MVPLSVLSKKGWRCSSELRSGDPLVSGTPLVARGFCRPGGFRSSARRDRKDHPYPVGNGRPTVALRPRRGVRSNDVAVEAGALVPVGPVRRSCLTRISTESPHVLRAVSISVLYCCRGEHRRAFRERRTGVYPSWCSRCDQGRAFDQRSGGARGISSWLKTRKVSPKQLGSDSEAEGFVVTLAFDGPGGVETCKGRSARRRGA